MLPVSGGGFDTTADALATHGAVATTLAVNPDTVNTIGEQHSRPGARALQQLVALPADEVVGQSYVPVNLAALSQAGLPGEIGGATRAGRRGVAHSGAQARRRLLGRPGLFVHAGRCGEPGRRAEGDGGRPTGAERHRSLGRRPERLHVRPTLHARSRPRLDHRVSRRELDPERSLHGEPGEPGARRANSSWPASPSSISRTRTWTTRAAS